jgi:hypothetical protein
MKREILTEIIGLLQCDSINFGRLLPTLNRNVGKHESDYNVDNYIVIAMRASNPETVFKLESNYQ